MDYKDTLLMPKTAFPMRGNLGVREPGFQARWEALDLYNKVLAKNKDNPSFILHDGPPYANGDIHIGHTLNKVLKDFVLRYQTMKGRHVPYVPGWDTHGLPIETALTKKGVNRKTMPLTDYRKLCREFAIKQIDRQREQFKRLGILGEWTHPYATFDPSYEAAQIRMFAKMVERGLIYKGLKPVYWSPSSESALAEAEIEYVDKQSTSIYVAFQTVDGQDVFKDAAFLIWTTTPWTLPANLAVSVHPDFDYVVVLADQKTYVVAETLLSTLAGIFKWESHDILLRLKGHKLEGMTYRHPLYDKVCPIIVGDHVTDTDGTGLVHTAPGHGEDDYRIGRVYDLDVFCPVDDRGFMMDSAGQFAGMYYEDANDAIVAELQTRGTLLFSEKFTHAYPHDWRTNKPVIFRATPQWFASIEQLKEALLDEVKQVKWLPVWGEVRISNMIAGREDWCISRQRAWGVPLPIFYAENDEPILDSAVLEHVAGLFAMHGSDVWYERDANDLLPEGFTHPGSPNGLFRKETDIMDVWFDSGTSHSVLENRGQPYPADLYLEGSDQYRGWFNSSLITGVAAKGGAPYRQIVSHGFVLDGHGRKMSKSLGNTIDPLVVMKQHGADVLRLWVATVDYQADVRISNEMINQIAEGYRKIRNTFRFMLGNLDGFTPDTDYISFSMRGRLNRVMTLTFDKLVKNVLHAYEHYQFDRVYRQVATFMINDLSAFYLDYTKDILYIEKEDDFERRSVQSTLYDILMGLLKLLTPIIPHTTSEAYEMLPFEHQEDVYLEQMPVLMSREDDGLMRSFERFAEVRDLVLKKLEEAREQKVIGKSLAAKVTLVVTPAQMDAIKDLEMTLHQVLIVSKVDLSTGDRLEAHVEPAAGTPCDRCWNVVEHKHDNGLCDRCHAIIKED
ncbi:MAG: isoleucine--tRNA ligase [Acholeplasmataceae bacterium]|nr:MAG: isoleucine--tRNA ligase [Acholeplasmataceae bacterium]